MTESASEWIDQLLPAGSQLGFGALCGYVSIKFFSFDY